MKNIFVATLFLFITSLLFAQTQAEKCWYNQDWELNKAMGVSSDKAYSELLKDKTAKPVIVAIIDGGTDINHEDLKDIIWTNEDEIPGNGIDDDKNGYIDDIHGWSFIGNPNGQSVNQDNLEVTRVYRMLKPKYEKADSASNADNKEFQLYLKCKKEVEAEYDNASKSLKNVITIESNLKFADSILTLHFKTKDYTDSQLKSIKSGDLLPLAEFVLEWKKKGFNVNSIGEIRRYFENTALYEYNIDFDPRYIVGDDWTDNSNPYYGCNDVIGPRSGHGTSVAGNVAAIRGNGIGPDGVASNVLLMIIRVVPDGDERDKDVANGILYAVNNGASIINMSFGKPYSPQKHFVDSALRIANQHDVLIMHAAGNESDNNDIIDHFPLNRDSNGNVINEKFMMIGASTTTRDKNLPAVFSNYGSKTVEVFAPGQNIYSCEPGNKYNYANGTSMACPIASGVAAIIRSYYPSLTALEVKEIIMQSAVKYDKKVFVPNQGNSKKKVKKSFAELSISGGIINVYNAIKLSEEKMKMKN